MAQRRYRLGLLIPPVNVTMEPECWRWAPAGVTVHAHRLYRSRAVLTVEELALMAERVEESARLVAFARPHLIVYGCTSGSLLDLDYDQRLVGRIEGATGVPAIATAGAVVEALRALGVRRVAVATPYPDDINEREVAFLEAHGFEVTSLEALRLRDSHAIPEVPPERVEALGRAADRPEAEALFISCTNFPTAEVLEPLEQALGKPVVSSNSASFWLALRRLGVEAPVEGAGRLLRGVAPVG